MPLRLLRELRIDARNYGRVLQGQLKAGVSKRVFLRIRSVGLIVRCSSHNSTEHTVSYQCCIV